MPVTISTVNTSDTPNSGRVKINSNFSSINTDLATTIHKDGSVAMDSTLNMSGYRVVNMGAGVDATDGVNYGQLLAEVNKRVVTNFFEVAPNYPTLDTTSQRFVAVFKALGAITDATTNNWYTIKVYPKKSQEAGGYSEDLSTYFKNYVNLVGENYPVITLVQDGNQDAIISGNGIIKGIRFRFLGHSITESHLTLQGVKFEDCTFYLGNGLAVADLHLNGCSMSNCKVMVPSTSAIIMDSTNYNLVNNCVINLDLSGTGQLESGCVNEIIPNLVNYYSY